MKTPSGQAFSLPFPPDSGVSRERGLGLVSDRKLRLTIRVRQSDSYRGKRISDTLLDLFKKNHLEGATVLLANSGYDARGLTTSTVLGLSIKLPMIIETVESREKLLPLMSTIKEIVGSNGLITVNEVDVI
jgi:PII-like signaling protein